MISGKASESNTAEFSANFSSQLGHTFLGILKNHFNNTFVGTTDLTYNKGFTSRIYMTKYINDIPNMSNNISGRGNNNNNTK